ncbi:MAG: outer membrane lipoprotein-sorting protein [Planctomycetes bacterium]|nr:outer membrane lipoprotein-sorting protein [Planctomycetota bacterium]
MNKMVMFVAVMVGTGVAATAQDAPSVDEIVKKANHISYYQGKDGRAKVQMTITDAQGRTRTREFTILRRDVEDKTDGEQKFYVYFHRPADVNKMVFMVWKHMNKDDDRWLYLPALDLVKRIAATDERTSFVGSNFFYEDVSGRNIPEDTHELAETTDNYYVLKNTPKDPKRVEFSYYKAWIHRATFIPVRIKYYDKQGREYRMYEVLKVEQIQGYPTVTKSCMKDLKTGGETVLEYSDVKYDIGLPDNIFTERYLRKAPRRYLR